MTKSRWKRAVLMVLLAFGLFQFYPRPEKNISLVESMSGIEQQFPIPDSVLTVLKSACYDCYTNHTHYPWYSNIQPVALFLDRHIVEGKKRVEF